VNALPALCLALGLGLALGPVAAQPAWADCARPGNAAAHITQTLAEINAYRRTSGLPALAQNDKLTKAAGGHACDLAKMRKLSHTGSNGSNLPRRVKAQGYQFRVINENIADLPASKSATKSAANLWFNSSGHRANMLDRGITELGLGLALGAGNRLYWVMVGGRAK